MSDNDFSRRSILKFGTFSALALGSSKILGLNVGECIQTPVQPKGPFYPVASQPDTNTDLTRVDGKAGVAKGDFIYLSGKVIDEECAPVAGCVVEIWQACVSGRYNHPGDMDNQNPLDPDFQYWGIAVTDNEGRYGFKTIIPGHYNASPTWIRPPHIHFKVYKKGIKELITQMYFKGNQYNQGDLILNKITGEQRDSVIRELHPRDDEAGRKAYDINFDIGVERIVA